MARLQPVSNHKAFFKKKVLTKTVWALTGSKPAVKKKKTINELTVKMPNQQPSDQRQSSCGQNQTQPNEQLLLEAWFLLQMSRVRSRQEVLCGLQISLLKNVQNI